MSNASDERHDYSRRRFFHSMVAGAAIGAARPWSTWLTPSRGAAAATKLPPDEAIKELVAGNQRFAANRLTSCGHDLAALREHTVEKQEPFAAVLACADSRVPVELVFDQSIGRLFVTRVAGNVASPEMHREPRIRRRRSLESARSSCSAIGTAARSRRRSSRRMRRDKSARCTRTSAQRWSKAPGISTRRSMRTHESKPTCCGRRRP